MTKQEFLDLLIKGLSSLPKDEVEERISFYSEIIDDRIEEGMPEEEAISNIGSVDEIITQIISEIPLTKIVKNRIIKEKEKKKETMKTWEIILIILGSPIWFSLLISLIAIAISLIASLIAIIIALWVTFIAVIASGIGIIAYGVVLIFTQNILCGVAMIGTSIFCFGLSIFLFSCFKLFTKTLVLLPKKLFILIKKCFIKKEEK